MLIHVRILLGKATPTEKADRHKRENKKLWSSQAVRNVQKMNGTKAPSKPRRKLAKQASKDIVSSQY